jgi:hypothetical protein
MNDSEPYDITRAVDSDDDHDVEMLRRIFPGRCNSVVHEFTDLTHSD